MKSIIPAMLAALTFANPGIAAAEEDPGGSQDRSHWEDFHRRAYAAEFHDQLPEPDRVQSRIANIVSGLSSTRPLLEIDGVSQQAALTVLNEHQDLGSAILEMCRLPYFGNRSAALTALAHYGWLEWRQCREVHALVLRELGKQRLALEAVHRAYPDANSPPGDVALRQVTGSGLFLYGPGVLARFPTAASVEELACLLEAPPGAQNQTASDALSVCLRPEHVPRIRAALLKAKSWKPWWAGSKTDYGRLVVKLEDPKAQIPFMPERRGIRYILPDPEAAAVNDLPPAADPLPPQLVAATPPAGRSWSWWWLLLLLPPAAAWAALRRKRGA